MAGRPASKRWIMPRAGAWPSQLRLLGARRIAGARTCHSGPRMSPGARVTVMPTHKRRVPDPFGKMCPEKPRGSPLGHLTRRKKTWTRDPRTSKKQGD